MTANSSAYGAADFMMLGTYRQEVARGLVHTPEWHERMTALQDEFDRQVAEACQRAQQPDGTIILPGWVPPEVLDAVLRMLQEEQR